MKEELERLNELAQEADIKMSLLTNTRSWTVDDYFRAGFKAGYRKCMELHE